MNNAPLYARIKPNYTYGIVKEEQKKEEPKKEESKKAEPKKQTFKQAFAAARKAGKATFMWDGRKFTTQTKEEKVKADGKKENMRLATMRGNSPIPPLSVGRHMIANQPKAKAAPTVKPKAESKAKPKSTAAEKARMRRLRGMK